MTCERFSVNGMTGIICFSGRRKKEDRMPFPETLDELQAAGYKFAGTGTCRGCGVQMAWFVTPNGKKMPMTRKPGGEIPKRFESHHAVCPKRGQFKKQ
jgi:hypothetical protein